MKFACPSCNNNIDVPPDWAGRIINCPHLYCGKSISVPHLATSYHDAFDQIVPPAPPPRKSAVTPGEEKQNLDGGAYGQYPGMKRNHYWMGTIGIGVLFLIVVAVAGGARERSAAGFPLLFFFSVFGFIQMAMAWSRMKNIGMEPAWSLLMLIPLVGLLPHVRCLAFQEGYEETKILDSTGKILCWILVGLFVGPVLLGIAFVTLSHLLK